MKPTQIHIEWSGPFSIKETLKFRGPKDYGIYQIYGGHVVYGCDALLYIGLAERQYFGQRIKQEAHWLENHDAHRIRVYLGRLADQHTPTDRVWGRHIIFAERLLIHSHSPAYNAQKKLGRLDQDLETVHIFNWGKYCDLLPEVSGNRWTGVLGPMPGYHVFDTKDARRKERR